MNTQVKIKRSVLLICQKTFPVEIFLEACVDYTCNGFFGCIGSLFVSMSFSTTIGNEIVTFFGSKEEIFWKPVTVVSGPIVTHPPIAKNDRRITGRTAIFS